MNDVREGRARASVLAGLPVVVVGAGPVGLAAAAHLASTPTPTLLGGRGRKAAR